MLLPCMICLIGEAPDNRAALASAMLNLCRQVDPEEIARNLCARHRHAHETSRKATADMLKHLIAQAKAKES
jgi:hypothetical protein